MDALKRHGPVAFVPIFLMVKVTAGRRPEGTVELAMNESVEFPSRYPIALILTTKSARPVCMLVVVAPLIWYVVFVLTPVVEGEGGVTVAGFKIVEFAIVGVVELASLKGIVVDSVRVVMTEREGSSAGVKTEPRKTAALPTRPTMSGT